MCVCVFVCVHVFVYACAYVYLNTFLFSSTIRCSRFILRTSCSSPRTSYFSKKLLFLLSIWTYCWWIQSSVLCIFCVMFVNMTWSAFPDVLLSCDFCCQIQDTQMSPRNIEETLITIRLWTTDCLKIQEEAKICSPEWIFFTDSIQNVLRYGVIKVFLLWSRKKIQILVSGHCKRERALG